MGNTTGKRVTDEQHGAGDGQQAGQMDGSPMDDSGFVFPDHNDLLKVIRVVDCCFHIFMEALIVGLGLSACWSSEKSKKGRSPNMHVFLTGEIKTHGKIYFVAWEAFLWIFYMWGNIVTTDLDMSVSAHENSKLFEIFPGKRNLWCHKVITSKSIWISGEITSEYIEIAQIIVFYNYIVKINLLSQSSEYCMKKKNIADAHVKQMSRISSATKSSGQNCKCAAHTHTWHM